MLWLYFTGAAILIGGEVNSEIENAAAEAGDPTARKRVKETRTKHRLGAQNQKHVPHEISSPVCKVDNGETRDSQPGFL
jgi:hypothetical protein